MPRPDQSDYLAHFTKGDQAYENLVSILEEMNIRAGTVPWVNRQAVCLSECPWPSLTLHAKRYSPYAVGFTKPHIFAAGGGPVYYVRAEHWEKQTWEAHLKTFATPFWPSYRPEATKLPQPLGGKTVDYSHEREWRVPHEFTFEPHQIAFVILKNYRDMARFPKELKDAIGRDKFILMDIYENIERLWPIHRLD